MGDFRTYMDAHGALPPECILGYLVVTSVEDAPYSAAHIEGEFKRLGLDESLLPPPPRADDRQIVRQLTREVRDAKGRKVPLDYEKVGDLVFYKPVTRGSVKSARVRATLDPTLSPSEHATLEQLLKVFNEAYIGYCNFHDGQKIRAIMRGYLAKLNAIMMQKSLYFVHASRADELLRFQEFVSGLKTDGKSTAKLLLIPLADLPHLRKEVVDVFQREATKELALVVSDIAKLRDTRKTISAEAYAKLKGQYDDIMTNATEYSRKLNISLDSTAGAMQVALIELQGLQRDLVTSSLKASQ